MLCLITGANAGIGRATAQALAARGDHVVMVCRSQERGTEAQQAIIDETGNDRVDLLLADLAAQAQIRALADRFKAQYDRLDVLINNAGVYLGDRMLTEDGIEKTFAVNHLAYFLLTNLLLDVLRASAPARIINVSSESHQGMTIPFDDLKAEQGYSGLAAYGQSKLANVLFTYELARRLEGTGVAVNAVHPGMVASRIWNRNRNPLSLLMRLFKPFMTRPTTSAEAIVHLATAPELEGVTGRYFKKKKPARSSLASYDEAAAKRLWDVSAAMTGLA